MPTPKRSTTNAMVDNDDHSQNHLQAAELILGMSNNGKSNTRSNMKDGRMATARLGKSVCGSGTRGSKSNSTSRSASVRSARSNINNMNKYITTTTGLANAEDTSSMGSSIPVYCGRRLLHE